MTPAARPGPVDLAAGVDPTAVHWDVAGLVAGVVQDVADDRVLMVGWLDAEALAATLGTGEVHFHSRSRGRLWRKGESSGNVLRLRTLAIDCDGDALLLGVEPAGPTCHRETRSCFDPDGSRAERGEAGLRLAGVALGDHRRAGRVPAGRLLHRHAAGRRRRPRRPEGRGGGHRGPAGGEERRGGRGGRRRPRRARGTSSRARRATSCTTRWCSWPNGTWSPPRSSTSSARATGSPPAAEYPYVKPEEESGGRRGRGPASSARGRRTQARARIRLACGCVLWRPIASA